jgi:hypothetical protein
MPGHFQQFFLLFSNLVMPVLAGLVFFGMARYVKAIGPLRTLIAGELTYKGAYLGFLFMGIYLASRPIQILFPHPWPLIVNNLREFCLIGVFGPAVLIAILSLVFGHDNVPRRVIVFTGGLGVALAAAFVVVNVFAVGGSEVIFQIGRLTAYDGVWFHETDLARRGLMKILFVIRLIDPVFLVLLSGAVAFWHARTYPVEKKILYDNMPAKLYLLGTACYAFALSMLSVDLLFLLIHLPNQWWIYYLGALAAGLLETLSLALPMRKHVQVSEHQ